jgi:hypothetical protein
MDRRARIERVLRCRKCYRTGTASWDVTPTGIKALVALSEGFHRRPRLPLDLPPELVCDCGAVQSQD